MPEQNSGLHGKKRHFIQLTVKAREAGTKYSHSIGGFRSGSSDDAGRPMAMMSL